MPADAFFSRLNPLFSLLLRSPLHWPLSTGVMLLTVTGRRSGRRYTIPVGYQVHGDTLTVMVSEARRKSWWRNYRQPGVVELRLRGRRRRGRAGVVASGSDEFRDRAARTLQRMPWLARVFGLGDYDRRAGLTDAQVERLGEEIVIVRLALELEDG